VVVEDLKTPVIKNILPDVFNLTPLNNVNNF
jgi:hypothetical protein